MNGFHDVRTNLKMNAFPPLTFLNKKERIFLGWLHEQITMMNKNPSMNGLVLQNIFPRMPTLEIFEKQKDLHVERFST
jgi:hypothetical protein